MKEVVIPVDRCVECGSKANIVFHHLIPESKGGRFTLPVCQMCHDKIHGVKKPRNISLSKLTKDGLKRARRNGVKLGTPNPEKAVAAMVAANKGARIEFATKVLPVIEEIRSAGVKTLQGIADCLNRRGIATRNGKSWHPSSVRNVISLQVV